MEVFTFEKSYLERLKEAEAVLSWEGAVMPASQVRSEWKSYVELKIEPAGKPPTHTHTHTRAQKATIYTYMYLYGIYRMAGNLENSTRYLRGSETTLSHHCLRLRGAGDL